MSNSCLIDPTTLVTTPKSNGGVPVANVVITSGKTPKGKAIPTPSPLSDDIQDSLFSPQPDKSSSAGFGNALFQPLLKGMGVGRDFSLNRIEAQNVFQRVGQSGGLDMRMDVTPRGIKLILKDNIRAHIFRHVKFWDKDEHGAFSEDSNTVCGIVLNLCNVRSTQPPIHAPTWWRETKHLVIKTHTDQRNNCIKTVHLRFNEILKAAMAECSLSTILRDNYLRANGREAFEYLMGLRNNNAHYLQFIDTFAPCVVGKFIWNNDANMERVCSAVHQQEFDTLFSVSDEAFILLLIDNYAERWNAEMALKKDLGVDSLTEEQEQSLPVTKYTYSRQKGKLTNGGGSGWSDTGHQRYNILYRIVQRDRRLRGAAFNKELLKVFQVRRLRDRKQKGTPLSNKKRKTVAFDDLNPPAFNDDENDLLGMLFNSTEV